MIPLDTLLVFVCLCLSVFQSFERQLPVAHELPVIVLNLGGAPVEVAQ